MDRPQNTALDPSPEPHRTHRTANPSTLWGKLVSFVTPAHNPPQKSIKNRDHLWLILIGAGLALFPIHNQWLTQLVTSNGEVGFFLPAFGTALWLIGSLLFITWNWERIQATGLGDKRVWIPLLVIVGAIGLSGIPADRWQDKISPLLMGGSLFALYLSARVLGKDVFLPLAVGVAVASLGVIVHQIIYPGQVTGGFVFEGNYDIVAGYVLLGVALFIHKWRWVLAVLATIAMLLTGSPEALFSLAIVGIVFTIREGTWRRILLAGGVAIILLLPIAYTGLYSYAYRAVQDEPASATDYSTELRQPIGYRLEQIGIAMTHIKLLGTGYSVTDFRIGIVHNVPLIIVQQLGWPGMLAGLAWLWVTIYCLVKTKWKYVWVLMLSLSVFDHFVWTQLAPWWWMAAGLSTANITDNDLILKTKAEEVHNEHPRVNSS